MKGFWQLSIVVVLAFAAEAADAEVAGAAGKDALHFVVGEVVQSTPSVQREFASVIVLLLAEVYLGEAGLARRQADSDSAEMQLSATLNNWAMGVEREAQRFLQLHDVIREGAPIKISPTGDTGSDLMLVIGEEVVLPGHPRSSQQADLEATIVAEFCRRADCLLIPHSTPRLSPRD